MIYRNARQSDLPGIQNFLAERNLPCDDIASHINNFVIIEVDNNIVAVGGLEIYDSVALLRSIAVSAKNKNIGLGKKILFLLEEKAILMGVKQFYLLTENAQNYFQKFGFSIIERDKVPSVIKLTKQFTSLCPDSAIAMTRDLNHQ